MRLPTLLACVVVLAACGRSPPPEPRAVAAGSHATGPATVAPPARSADTAPSLPPPDAAPVDAGSPDAGQQACADSSECAAGALCCGSVRVIPMTREEQRARGPFDVLRHEERRICTSSPEKECHTIELCKGSSCRRPQPRVRLRCGAITCADPTPICLFDLRSRSERAGEKARPPRCVDRSPEADAPGGAVLSCVKTEDCPRGATCELIEYGYRARVESACVYTTRGAAHGMHPAPACRSDADCTRLPEAYGAPAPVRCRPVRGAPSGVRVCAVSGFERL